MSSLLGTVLSYQALPGTKSFGQDCSYRKSVVFPGTRPQRSLCSPWRCCVERGGRCVWSEGNSYIRKWKTLLNATTAFLFVIMAPKVTCHIPMSYWVSVSELNQGIGQWPEGLLLYEEVGKGIRKWSLNNKTQYTQFWEYSRRQNKIPAAGDFEKLKQSSEHERGRADKVLTYPDSLPKVVS